MDVRYRGCSHVVYTGAVARVSLDILADIEAGKRPRGSPCTVAVMRRDRPDLVEQWVRVLEAKKAGETDASDADIAAWFCARDFPMTRNVSERHRRRDSCAWCRQGHEVTA